MINTEDFYKNLPVLTSFSEAANFNNHHDLPSDWWVVVADVLGSTKAIEGGKYKQVNTIGASTIMAVMNADRSIEIPYVFGGDGATLAIPPQMEIECRRALLGAQELARNGFGLDLRVGLVPVDFLKKNNLWLRIGKIKVSNHITQASLTGRGWEFAEELIKNVETRAKFEVGPTEGVSAKADFSGLECRWQGIKSRKDHKICLLILSMSKTPEKQLETYNDIFAKLADIYGNLEDHHPVRKENLKLTFSFFKLVTEAKVFGGSSVFKKFYLLLKAWIANLIGLILFAYNVDTKKVNWSTYRDDLISNSDYRKFDGMLKMVFDGTSEQREKIEAYLEKKYQANQLVYGIHVSKEAIVTCLVFSRNQNHAHFIDGSEGGYAMAAVELKQKLKIFKSKAMAA